MAQDLTLGRVGLATSAGGDGLVLRADSWSQEGDRASVSGVIRGRDLSSLADVKALRDQLVGYGPENTDEPVVPVTWAQDSSRDGFYRVVKVETGSELTGRLRAGADGGELAVPWSADLVRVPGWRAPLIEVATGGANRTNSASETPSQIWVAIPETYTVAHIDPGLDIGYSGGAVSGENADARVIYTNNSGFYGQTVVYSVDVDDFYDAACRIRAGDRVASSTSPSFTSHATVVGRQIDVDPMGWLIENELVRVFPGPSTGEFVTGQWEDSTDGGSDEWTYKTWKVTNGGAGTSQGDAVAVAVLRNGPECAAVRIYCGTSVASVSTHDFTVRRGSKIVEVVSSRVGEPTTGFTHGVFRFATEAAASDTGGMIAAADDADGNKYRVRCNLATTVDTTNGGVYLSSAATTAAFGVDTDWSTVAHPVVTEAWYAAINHRQQIAAR